MKENSIDETTLTEIINKNMGRREKMIDPFFKGENIPSDPREIRLMNEVMTSQTNDATTLLSIFEKSRENDNQEAIKDMMAEVVKISSGTLRAVDIPEVNDNLLPLNDVDPIEEGATVELRKYTEDNE